MPRASCRWTTSIYAMPRGRCVQHPADRFVIRFMLDWTTWPAAHAGQRTPARHLGPFQMVHHGQTYHVYFGLNVETPYLFLFIQILDHPIRILGIAMLVSTPLCLLLAWRLARPHAAELQQSVSQLAQGNLEIRIPNLGRRDEIGQLAEHVSRMVPIPSGRDPEAEAAALRHLPRAAQPPTRIQLAQALIRRKQGDSAELAHRRGDSPARQADGDLLDLSRVQQHVGGAGDAALAELLEPSWTMPCSGQTRTANSSRAPPCPPDPSPWPELLARLENPLRNALKVCPRVHPKVDWYREGREWVMTMYGMTAGVPVEQQPRLFLPALLCSGGRYTSNAKTGALVSALPSPPGDPASWGTIRASGNQPTGLVITIRLPMPDLPFFIGTGAGYAGARFAPARILPCSISCSTSKSPTPAAASFRLCANTGYRLHLIEPLGFRVG